MIKRQFAISAIALLTLQPITSYAMKDFVVTNTNEFRQALAAKGERSIHFKAMDSVKNNPMGLILSANDHEDWLIENGDITIDGTDANTPVTLYGATLRINAKNVKLLNIHVRLGATGFTRRGKNDKEAKNVAREALHLEKAKNVEIRNSSFSWGTDETVNIISSDNVKFIDSIVSEPLNEPKDQYGEYIHYEKQPHGYCMLIVGSNNVLIQNTLFANCLRRSPSISPDGKYAKGTNLVANNIIYNYGDHGSKYNDGSNDFSKLSYTLNKNYYIPGANTHKDTPAIEIDYPNKDNTLKLTTIDNFKQNKVADVVYTKDDNKGKIKHNDKYQLKYEEGKLIPAIELEANLLDKIGPRLPSQDLVDARVIKSVKARTGKFIDHENQLPEYPYFQQAMK